MVLTCPKGEYDNTVAEVRAKIKLSEIGISGGITNRTAVTGVLIIEVPESEHDAKADALAALMREVLRSKEGVCVDRPVKTAEIRIRGLEVSIGTSEVAVAVIEKANCRVDDIQTGVIRRISPENRKAFGSALVTAKKAAEGGNIMIGWSCARGELLEARPLLCFKCSEREHVRETCPNSQDRSQRCYRYEDLGHISRYQDPSKCPICTDLRRPTRHTLGSPKCAQRKRREVGRGTRGNANSPSNFQQPLQGSTSRGGGKAPILNTSSQKKEEKGAIDHFDHLGITLRK